MEPLDTVLVVSNQGASRLLHQRQLQRFQVAHQVLVATSLEEVLALLEGRHLPAVLLLDMGLQQENLAFLRACQQRPLVPNVPVVLLAASVALTYSTVQLEELQQLPVTAILEKPLTEEKAQALLHFSQAVLGNTRC